MSELKPCPFCGGDAELDKRRGYAAMISRALHNEVAIYCLGCGADMACDPQEIGADIDSVVQQLTDAWNARRLSKADVEKGARALCCGDEGCDNEAHGIRCHADQNGCLENMTTALRAMGFEVDDD